MIIRDHNCLMIYLCSAVSLNQTRESFVVVIVANLQENGQLLSRISMTKWCAKKCPGQKLCMYKKNKICFESAYDCVTFLTGAVQNCWICTETEEVEGELNKDNILEGDIEQCVCV